MSHNNFLAVAQKFSSPELVTLRGYSLDSKFAVANFGLGTDS